MTYEEYVSANSYRNRLLEMLRVAERVYSSRDIDTFAAPIRTAISRVESEMVSFEKCSGALCGFVGLKTFKISQQIATEEPALRWNSPLPQPSPAVESHAQIEMFPVFACAASTAS